MHIKKGFLALCFLLLTQAFAEESCGPGKIKYTNKGKEVVKALSFCVQVEKRGILLTSITCKGGQCKELKDPHKRPVNLGKYPDTIGSPGFKVCRELGGSPQIIEYQYPDKFKDQWKQSSRCLFREDTFASNNFLMKLWKPFIIE